MRSRVSCPRPLLLGLCRVVASDPGWLSRSRPRIILRRAVAPRQRGARRCPRRRNVTDGLAAVLFDMDGLLVDTEPLWLETETGVMARLGAPWTPEDQQALLGGSMRRTVGYLLAKATRPAPPETVERWMMEGMLDRVRAGRVTVRPGARELLAAVAGAGLPYALVASS